MASDAHSRHLIAFGAKTYGEGFDALEYAERELEAVEALFARCGFTAACREIRLDGPRNKIEESIRDFFKGSERRPSDVVVLYFTGHGEVRGSKSYLCLAGAHQADIGQHTISPGVLAEWIFLSGNRVGPARPQHYLVLFDACYSGEHAAAFAAEMLTDLRGDLPENLCILTATGPLDTARPLVFTRAMEEAFDELLNDRYAPPQQPYVELNDWLDRVQRRLRAAGRKPLRIQPNVSDERPFLRNPRFDSAYTGRNLEEAELAAHFAPRARGVESAAEPGQFFAGRERALGDIAEFLVGDGNERTPLVVTGDPGSGKSSVLGRVVLCAAEGGLLTADVALPPLDHAVHARGLTLHALVGRVGSSIGVDAPEALLERLKVAPCRLRFVIDALDEAAEPERIATDLLGPLARVPGVSVVVGTRRPLIGILGDEHVIDLDAQKYFARTDLERCVEGRLIETPHSPYAKNLDLARRAAVEVAQRSGHSFLVASIHARSLADASNWTDLGNPNAWAGLSSDLGHAFEQDLAQRFGKDRARTIRDVLTPLAFSFGRGLPHEDLWHVLAGRIAGRHIAPEDVDAVKRDAGFYIAPDLEDGIGVYRLYHERFAEHLRKAHDERSVHESFTAVLGAEVPSDRSDAQRWEVARPYAKRYLAAHALRAGALQMLLDDLAFVPEADPAGLLDALSRSPAVRASAVGAVIWLAGDLLLTALDAGERAAQLELRALRQGEQDIWRRLRARDANAPWHADWMTRTTVDPHLVVGRHLGVRCVHLGWIDGQPVVASAGKDGHVRLWSARSGTAYGEPLGLGSDWRWPRCVRMGNLEGTPIVVSGNYGVELWNARTGARLGDRLPGDTSGRTSGVAWCVHKGLAMVVSGSDDGLVRLWDVVQWKAMHDPLVGHTGPVRSVDIGVVDGAVLVVSGGKDGIVRLWDVHRGEALCEPMRVDDDGEVVVVQLATLDETPVVISAYVLGSVRVWNARTGKLIRNLFGQDQVDVLHDLHLGVQHNSMVVAADGKDATVRLWNARTGKPFGHPLRGHRGMVQSVHVAALDGALVVVSGGTDDTVRLWDVWGTGDEQSTHVQQVAMEDVRLHDVEGEPIAVSQHYDGMVRLWNARTGLPFGAPLCGEGIEVRRLALGILDGTIVVVSGHDDGTLRQWDARTGKSRGAPIADHESFVSTVAWGVLDGTAVIISGGSDGTVRRWHADSGMLLGQPMEGHEETVTSVLFGALGGTPVVISGSFDKTVRVWDARTGKPLRSPLCRQHTFIGFVRWIELEGVSTVVVGCLDGTIMVCDANTGLALYSPKQRHAGFLCSLQVTRWQRETVVVSSDTRGFVCLWDLRTGDSLAEWHFDPGRVYAGLLGAEPRLFVRIDDTFGVLSFGGRLTFRSRRIPV